MSSDSPYVESERDSINGLTGKAETQRMNLWLPRGRLREGVVREFELEMYTPLSLKWITSKGVGQETLLSVPWQPGG